MMQFGIYDGALKESIHLLKFNGIKRLARPLSMLLLQLPLGKYDGVVPVPLHPKKLREREFNQTALLARFISKSLKIPILLNVLEKTRETKLQTEVSGQGRRANLRKAFSAVDNVSGMHLLLLDDVITTGATVRECAAILRKAGAADVQAIALARSVPKY
jgi:ComF family protein